MTGLSLPVMSLLVITPFMIAVGQVLFKMTSIKLLAKGDAAFHMALLQPLFILALAIYGAATLLWIYVLKTVPLAYAYSFMALTFVLVPLLASWWLGEVITYRYMIGACLIIIGLFVAHN